ncbi:MAG: hypothetical protein CSB24_00805 [Deltaproteobacteria bacterium]|nr:MAG: hypothetical protein CSB24_00805 [Deltaproteobacteria bacterium]
MEPGRQQLELQHIFRAIFIALIVFTAPLLDGLLAAGFIAALVIGLVFNYPRPLWFALTLIPLGWVLSQSYLRGDTPNQAGVRGVITQGASWLGYGYVVSILIGKPLYGEIIRHFTEAVDGVILQYRSLESIPAEELILAEQALSQMKMVVPLVLPSLFACGILFLVCLNMVCGNLILARLAKKTKPWPWFRMWQLPDKMVWMLIAAGLPALTASGTYRVIGINLLIFFALSKYIPALQLESKNVENKTETTNLVNETNNE